MSAENICPTCNRIDNEICSNPFHVSRYIESATVEGGFIKYGIAKDEES